MHILIIDDDDATARSILLCLKQAKFEAGRVGTGTEGLSWAAHNDYDLIILDLGLPDLSGHEPLGRDKQMLEEFDECLRKRVRY